MFHSVGAILPQHGCISAVGGLELLMRHFDEGAFHFPDVFFREPPVTFDQSPQVGDPVACDSSGPIHVRVNVTHHQLPEGGKDWLAPVQAGIPGAGYCPPSSPAFEEEKDVIQLVLGFEVEKQGG